MAFNFYRGNSKIMAILAPRVQTERVTFVKTMKPIEIAEQYETTHFDGDGAVLETVGHISAVQRK